MYVVFKTLSKWVWI